MQQMMLRSCSSQMKCCLYTLLTFAAVFLLLWVICWLLLIAKVFWLRVAHITRVITRYVYVIDFFRHSAMPTHWLIQTLPLLPRIPSQRGFWPRLCQCDVHVDGKAEQRRKRAHLIKVERGLAQLDPPPLMGGSPPKMRFWMSTKDTQNSHFQR